MFNLSYIKPQRNTETPFNYEADDTRVMFRGKTYVKRKK